MGDGTVALIISFLSVVFVVCAYFVKNKEMYLVFQALCIVALILSYLVTGHFFATVGLAISLVRTLVFFFYEQKNCNAPLWVSFALGVATCIAYVIVNLLILKDAQPKDLILLTAGVMYAFIFRIRNLKIVRYTMFAPTALSIVYNLWISAPIFVTLSYVFEAIANGVSIVRYYTIPWFRARKLKAGEVEEVK